MGDTKEGLDWLFVRHEHPNDGPAMVTLDDAYTYAMMEAVEFTEFCELNGYHIKGMDDGQRIVIYKQFIKERRNNGTRQQD